LPPSLFRSRRGRRSRHCREFSDSELAPSRSAGSVRADPWPSTLKGPPSENTFPSYCGPMSSLGTTAVSEITAARLPACAPPEPPNDGPYRIDIAREVQKPRSKPCRAPRFAGPHRVVSPGRSSSIAKKADAVFKIALALCNSSTLRLSFFSSADS
jgi:hypothetical protein